ncbi:hypothetical protein RCL1_001343 [Eukaryota sp. TZLM3-RCL]
MSSFILFLITVLLCTQVDALRSCNSVTAYQYECTPPEISESTHQPTNCQPSNLYTLNCTVYDAVECDGDRTFPVSFPCRFPSEKSYFRAVGYSIFSGFIGLDRFYLGYPTIAIAKAVTLAGFIMGSFIDFIATILQLNLPNTGVKFDKGPLFQRVNPRTYERYDWRIFK